MEFGTVKLVSLCVLMGVSVYTDIRYHKILNKVCLLALLSGLLTHLIYEGMGPGFGNYSIGFSVAFISLFPFYFMGGMAAGDVKLMAVAGGILGYPDVFIAVVTTLIAGSIMSLIVLFFKFGFSEVLIRMYRVLLAGLRVTGFYPTGDAPVLPSIDRQDSDTVLFPYAMAIAAGSFYALFT